MASKSIWSSMIKGISWGYALTAGVVDDCTALPQLVQRVFGKLFGDKGHILQALDEHLWQERCIQLITKIRQNMANRLMDFTDKLLAVDRAAIRQKSQQRRGQASR